MVIALTCGFQNKRDPKNAFPNLGRRFPISYFHHHVIRSRLTKAKVQCAVSAMAIAFAFRRTDAKISAIRPGELRHIIAPAIRFQLQLPIMLLGHRMAQSFAANPMEPVSGCSPPVDAISID